MWTDVQLIYGRVHRIEGLTDGGVSVGRVERSKG